MADHIDPDAPTQLDFEPLDPEPTGRAESLAWSGEGEAEAENYPFSPESAPTAIVEEAHSGTPVVIGAVVLAAAVMVFAAVTALVMTRPSTAPVTAPGPTTPPTTIIMTQTPQPPPAAAPPPAALPPQPPVVAAPAPTMTPEAPPPVVRPNGTNEAKFVMGVRNNIPDSVIPGGGRDDMGMVMDGYRACQVMRQYPDNDARATAAFFGEKGFNTPVLINSPDYPRAVQYMSLALTYLCPDAR